MIEGRRVADTLSAMVVPGSARVKAQAESEGLDEVFRAAGFDWRSAGCSMCLGMNPDILSPGSAAHRRRTATSRAARARGRTHLVSPKMAAAAAIEGTFVDIRSGHEPRGRDRGPVSVLDRADVDTDQIIPKQFLKRVERTGFGEFLFYDWIRDGEIELEPNPILVPGPTSAAGPRASTPRGRFRTSASRP